MDDTGAIASHNDWVPLPVPLPASRFGLYDPIAFWVAECDEATFHALSRFHRGQADANDLRRAQDIATLVPVDQSVWSARSRLAVTAVAPPSPTTVGVTLFVTGGCNLRCEYCYARAGAASKEMTLATAISAIRAARKRLKPEAQAFVLEFHGGGEPTTRVDLINQVLDLAPAIADPFPLSTIITTNGVVGNRTRALLASRFDRVIVSCDGPPWLQNLQRPTPNHGASAGSVEKTIRALAKARSKFTVRATLTRRSLGHIGDILDYFSNLGVRNVHLEPITSAGVAFDKALPLVSPDEAVIAATEAMERATALDLAVSFAGVSIGTARTVFCSAQTCHTCVTHDGRLIACYEGVDDSHPEYALFSVGILDQTTDDFHFDAERVAGMQERSVDKIAECSDCFCKWHCAGGCAARALRTVGRLDSPDPIGCSVTRAVTASILDRVLAGKSTQLANYSIVPEGAD